MIVVLGNRHDEVAVDLTARWPDAALCSAQDLTRPGWAWSVAGATPGVWVIDGQVVSDELVTGVFLRRSTVHAEELTSTHPDDRVYLAAEAHALLVHVLARTGAIVVNPVDDGGMFGEGALRPERWMEAASDVGVEVAPLRVRSSHRPRPPEPATTIEVVEAGTVGDAPEALGTAAVAVCRRLGLRWAIASFDRRGRLSAITTAPPPSAAASTRLEQLLAGVGPV